jgi:phage terminase large subunit-like protein
MLSPAEQVALREDRQEFWAKLAPDEEAALALEHSWPFWARPKQRIPPGTWWLVWLIMTGRGFGKTRTGAETIHEWAHDYSPIAIIGSTAHDVRQVMVEGIDTGAGLLSCAAPWWRPVYEPSKTRLTWPNGAVAFTYGADEPETFRGPQHQKGWLDEIGKWRYLNDAMDNVTFGMRLGDNPQMVISTTPKPKKRLIELARSKRTVITRGSMFENARNLAPKFLEEILERYGGTRQGLQEIEGQLLEELEGALFPRARIDTARVRRAPESLKAIAVAVDPAAGSGPDSNDTGIICAGSDTRKPAHFYVLADRTCHLPPGGWAAAALNAYHEFRADAIVAEINNGGEMVEAVIRNAPNSENVKVRVVHASRGKVIRAQPISLLYEQGRVHHVSPARLIVPGRPSDELAALEDQMTTFDDEAADVARRRLEEDASSSPDRVDALVWALTYLSERRVGGVGA